MGRKEQKRGSDLVGLILGSGDVLVFWAFTADFHREQLTSPAAAEHGG